MVLKKNKVSKNSIKYLTKDQINKTKKTQDILNKAIAIPIWLKKNVEDYSILGKVLKNLK